MLTKIINSHIDSRKTLKRIMMINSDGRYIPTPYEIEVDGIAYLESKLFPIDISNLFKLEKLNGYDITSRQELMIPFINFNISRHESLEQVLDWYKPKFLEKIRIGNLVYNKHISGLSNIPENDYFVCGLKQKLEVNERLVRILDKLEMETRESLLTWKEVLELTKN